MNNALLISILLSIATGLSIIAFKTPRIFHRLVLPFCGILLFISIVVISWDIGYQKAHSVLFKFISSEKSSSAELAFNEYSVPWIFALYIVCSYIFILFLYWLSHVVIEHEKDEYQKKKLMRNSFINGIIALRLSMISNLTLNPDRAKRGWLAPR